MSKRQPEKFDVRQIRFSKDIIDEHFDNGKKISDVLSDLQTGLLDLDQLPPITLVKKGKLYFSLDNRRLWVLKQYAKFLEEKKKEILQIPVKYESAQRLGITLLTTTSEGECVKILEEGSNGGNESIETVRLSEVRYSDESIYTGHEKRKLDHLIGNIHEPAQLPVLRVFRREGHLFTLDNNELWLIKRWYDTNVMMSEEKTHKVHQDELRASDVDTNEGAADGLGADNSIKDTNDNKNADIYGDFTIKVELRPYNELPEYFTTLDEGKTINMKNKKTKCKKPKFKKSY